MEIPKSLIEAKAEFEAALARQAGLIQSATGMGNEAAQAAQRIPECDDEIEQLHGRLVADDALASIPAGSGARMGAKERAAVDKQLGALRAQRDQLRQKAETGEVAARALRGAIAERAVEVLDSAAILVEENRKFRVLLEAEFHRDVGRLVLPELFRKWSAIHEGLAPGGSGRLDALALASQHPDVVAMMYDPLKAATLPNFGSILCRGQYYDLDAMAVIDWKAWQTDPQLAALHRQLGEIAAGVSSAKKAITADRECRRLASESERRADERRRQAAYKPVPVYRYEYVPAMTRLEAEPRTLPPHIIGRRLE